MSLTGIRVIIWDVDGTLYHAPDLSHEVYESAYKAIEEVRKWPREQTVAEFEKVHGPVTLSATEAVARICGITTPQAAVLTDKYLNRLRFIRKDDRLIGLFTALSGFTHYILGNGSKSEIIKGLEALGLAPRLFAEIVTSETVGVNKPSDKGFRYIMEKTGLPAAAHLMVGDRERVDLVPARSVGMKTCLVWADSSGAAADVTLATVYDLAMVVSK